MMPLVTNRKRPRGLSGIMDSDAGRLSLGNKRGVCQVNNTSMGTNYDRTGDGSSDINMDLGISLDTQNDDFQTNKGNYNKRLELDDNVFIENSDEEVVDDNEDDDEIIILEERKIGPASATSRRNYSDSHLTGSDSFAAYNFFNVNKDNYSYPQGVNPSNLRDNNILSKAIKKQRTNSLPQLPQVKCFYAKPSHYTLQFPKLGNVETSVIPHDSDSPPCDDKDGHYIVRINEVFARRFIMLKLLGQGTFGKVVECYDKVRQGKVAIKIIRNIPKYRDAAKIELRILTTLKKFDNDNINHCLHLIECFDYRGHICFVTDLLKISLYDFLERNKYISFPGSHIQAISKQLLRSVAFLHDLNLIHTDLKPENILLYDDSFTKKNLKSNTILSAYKNLAHVKNSPSRRLPRTFKVLKNPLIQVIDFGSAIFNDEYHSSVVSTRHYRAPEIVLGTGWSFPCDLWSIGCILVELIIGEPLFKTHENLEHLAMIEKVCGAPIDESMVELSRKKGNECGVSYFIKENRNTHSHLYTDLPKRSPSNWKLHYPMDSTSFKSTDNVNQLSRIDRFISNRIGLDINLDLSLLTNFVNNEHIIDFGNFTFWWFFIDLLKRLLTINPYDRLNAVEALDHPWFNLGIEDEGTVDYLFSNH